MNRAKAGAGLFSDSMAVIASGCLHGTGAISSWVASPVGLVATFLAVDTLGWGVAGAAVSGTAFGPVSLAA